MALLVGIVLILPWFLVSLIWEVCIRGVFCNVESGFVPARGKPMLIGF